MKGMILAGGEGTRLRPLTLVTNKHLLPVYNKPMIFYPLYTLKTAGIKDVIVIVSGEHAGHIMRILGNGADFGMNISYGYQVGAGGIAEAIKIGRSFIGEDNFMVILGDNVSDLDLKNDVKTFTSGCRLYLKNVQDPQRYGVAEVKGDKIISIKEKPENPKSNWAVTGLYIYDSKAFGYIDKLKPSKRNELEVTDLNNIYIKAGDCSWGEVTEYWQDAGTFESLWMAGEYWREKSLK